MKKTTHSWINGLTKMTLQKNPVLNGPKVQTPEPKQPQQASPKK